MRRVLRGFGKLLAWLVLGLVALVVLVAFAIQLPPVRAWIRDQALAAARGSIHGEIALDDVRWPSLDHLELSGLSVRDTQGKRALSLATLMVQVDLPSLFGGQLVLNKVEVSDLYVDLADFGDQSGLLSLFASDEPKPQPQDPNAPLSPIAVVLRNLCIEHGQVKLAPAVEQSFALEQLQGCVRLRVERRLYVATDGLQARVLRNGEQVAQLRPESELSALTDAADLQPMLASLRGQLELRGEAMRFDGWLRARGFSGSTLHALGVESDMLQRGLNLDLHAHQTDGRLAYRALLDSRAGRIEAKGALDAQNVLSAHVASAALEPSAISSLQLPKLGFALDAQARLGDPSQRELRASLVRGYYDHLQLPRVDALAVQQQDGTTLLKRLEVSYGDAGLSATGRLSPDGALQAQAKLSVPELSQLPPLKAAGVGARGDLSADFSVKRDARDLWDARLKLSSHTLAIDAAQAQDVALDAGLSGVIARPVVRLDLQAREVAAADRTFTQLGVSVEGGPQRYQLRVDADEQTLHADGWLEPGLRAWDAAFNLEAQLPEGKAVARIDGLRFVPGESLRVGGLHARFVDARVTARGKIDLQGSGSRLRLDAEVPDMTQLLTALGQNPLPGKASLRGTVRGALDRPAADLALRYTHGPQFAGEPSRIELDLKADASRGRARVDLTASAGSARVEGGVSSRWSRRLPLSAAIEAARHDASIRIQAVPIANLLDPQSPLPNRLVDGLLRGTIRAQGNLDELQFDAELKSRLRTSRDRHSVDVVFNADYRDAQFKLSLDAGDRRGQLLTLRASTQLSLERQLDAPVPPQDLLSAKSWELKLELAERPLGELPFFASLGLEEDLAPLRVGMHAQLGHAPQSEPDGTLEAQLRWEPPRVLRPARASCVDRASGRALLQAKWAQQKLGVELSAGAHTNETIQVSARARVPFSELLAGGLKEFAGVQLAAKVQELKLRDLPWACRRGSGQISLDAQARDLLTPRADVSLQLDAKALQWRDSPELAVDLEASTSGKALLVAGKLQTGTGLLHLDGRLPVNVHAAEPSRMLRRKDPVEIELRLQHMPMAALLAFVPGVARVSGTTAGQLRVRGTPAAPELKGQLELNDVSLTLPRLGQRFSHVHVQASVDGSTLRLSEGRVKDLDGSASIAALLKLESMERWRAEVNLNARNFPLRKSGLILGRADANAHIEASMTREQARVSVSLSDVAIVMNSEDVGDVQSLEPHPEFSFVDTRMSEQQQPKSEPAKDGKPTQIHVTSKAGVWVRRDDFAVEMQPDITIVLADGGSRLQGEIELLRGYISLFGQSFDIERGRVVLAGGENIDPQLDISATHDTPGGSRVGVKVTGFARAPELEFSVDGKAATARDALLAITGGGRGGGGKGTPEQQIAAAAVGMTTGLLTLGARREFGDWVPMLAIEQGRNTRVRVGIEADQFIPSFLKGFVRGAYVEGIVSTQNNNADGSNRTGSSSSGGAATASGTGVLLELMLPSHFVWAGQYGPGQAWSIDLDWRP